MKKNILEYFFETVDALPNKIAVSESNAKITFAQLDQSAQALANKIIATKDLIKVPIAVYLDKSIDLIIADIGITYSGNFFMNLDVKSPEDRIRNIIDLVKPTLIITDAQKVSIVKELTNSHIIQVDDLKLRDENYARIDLKRRLNKLIDTDPFCVINTSGSTGTPKGVVLNHRSYANYTRWGISKFNFNADTKLGVLSPVIFDHFHYELCLMMTTGAELVLLDNNQAMFPIKILENLKSSQVNYIFWVPTIMVNIANMDLLSRISLPELKMIWFAGEVFPTKQFNYWRAHFPESVFVNLYGPTEATVDCTFYVVDRILADDEPIPIGNSCNNTDVIILDDQNNIVDKEGEGELCIRGTSLAMGYYNNPEKTAEAFVQNPLNISYPEIIYRTGDVVEYNIYGELIFKGRKDTLIKHLGYRIELGEIEHLAINNLNLFKNACALYNQTKKEILLVYESESEIPITIIRKELSRVLPKYMIPTIIDRVDQMPRNANGKIDRALLRKMFC